MNSGKALLGSLSLICLMTAGGVSSCMIHCQAVDHFSLAYIRLGIPWPLATWLHGVFCLRASAYVLGIPQHDESRHTSYVAPNSTVINVRSRRCLTS